MYNLAKKRKKKESSPLERLRGLSRDLRRIRRSDLDGANDDEVLGLVNSLSAIRTASIGGQPTTFDRSSPRDPYKDLDPRTRVVPEFGGRWRDALPSCDNNTNDWDVEKSLNEQAVDSGYNDTVRLDKVNEDLNGHPEMTNGKVFKMKKKRKKGIR